MLRCYLCGHVLLRAAATITTARGSFHAGPVCAKRTGMLPPRAVKPTARSVAVRRSDAADGQTELFA